MGTDRPANLLQTLNARTGGGTRLLGMAEAEIDALRRDGVL